MNATIQVPDYAGAKALYVALCAEARKQFDDDTSAAHVLQTTVAALSCEYDFGHDGIDLAGLRHLTPELRTTVLALIAYIVGEKYYPSEFRAISRAAFADL